MGGSTSIALRGTRSLSSQLGRGGIGILSPSVEGNTYPTAFKSRLSHVKLFTTASPERRRPLGKFRRLDGLSPTSQEEEVIFDYKSGKVNQRSNKNGAKEKATNLRAGSIIVSISSKFGEEKAIFNWQAIKRKHHKGSHKKEAKGTTRHV